MHPYSKGELLGGSGGNRVYRMGEMAYKVSSPGHAAQDLESEARLLCSLHHPHILPGLGLEQGPEGPVLVMPYAKGGTLKGLLQQGPLPLEQALQVCCQVLDALEHLRSQGVVAHRDVKPANILFDGDGKVLLGDLGSALTQGASTNGSPTFVGTLAYAAPEQIRDSQRVDIRCDIFAVGSILFEMLEGRRWMQGADSRQIYRAKMRGGHPATLGDGVLDPSMKTKMEAVIQRACAPQAEDRYQDPREFRDALPQVEAGLRRRRTPLPLLAAAAVFILGSFLALGVAEGLILLPVA